MEALEQLSSCALSCHGTQLLVFPEIVMYFTIHELRFEVGYPNDPKHKHFVYLLTDIRSDVVSTSLARALANCSLY